MRAPANIELGKRQSGDNISGDTTREPREHTGFKHGLFNVSFHYDPPFLLRVPHLNNTFPRVSATPPRSPLALPRSLEIVSPVHVKHRECSPLSLSLSLSLSVATRASPPIHLPQSPRPKREGDPMMRSGLKD
jgi:hypothetical protein